MEKHKFDCGICWNVEVELFVIGFDWSSISIILNLRDSIERLDSSSFVLSYGDRIYDRLCSGWISAMIELLIVVLMLSRWKHRRFQNASVSAEEGLGRPSGLAIAIFGCSVHNTQRRWSICGCWSHTVDWTKYYRRTNRTTTLVALRTSELS